MKFATQVLEVVVSLACDGIILTVLSRRQLNSQLSAHFTSLSFA